MGTMTELVQRPSFQNKEKNAPTHEDTGSQGRRNKERRQLIKAVCVSAYNLCPNGSYRRWQIGHFSAGRSKNRSKQAKMSNKKALKPL